MEKKPADISADLSIAVYLHCGKCLDEKPRGICPKDWSRTQVGFTKLGIQIWCSRHYVNVCHIDFEGHTHPANTSA